MSLLNNRELMQALGISERTFYRMEKDGKFRRFLTAMPLGQKKYAKALVDRYLAGESLSQFGSRRA